MFHRRPRTWSFHAVVLQRTAKKCTKIYNARAQLLFCSLNFLFSDVLVCIVILVCLSSLFSLDAMGELRVVERIHPQSDKFATGVGNKATGDSKVNDSPETSKAYKAACLYPIHIQGMLGESC